MASACYTLVMTKKTTRRAPKRACPICGDPEVPVHQPFCSQRCADVDLGRWLKGSYVVPTDERPEPGSDDERDPE